MQEDSPQTSGKRWSAGALIGAITAIGVLLGGLGAVLGPLSGGGGDDPRSRAASSAGVQGNARVRVPNVIEYPLSDARDTIEGAGLRARLSRCLAVHTPPAPLVMYQSPDPDALAPRGTRVALTISRDDPGKVAEPEGVIFDPGDDTEVSRNYTVHGAVTKIPRGNHVWVAVESGAGLSPKTPEVPLAEDDCWTVRISEAGFTGSQKDFQLTLLMLGARGHRVIEQWLEHGRATGNWPPLAAPSDSAVLDTVSLTLRE